MVFATARHLCVKPINTCRVSAAGPAPSRRTPTLRLTSTSGPQSRKANSNGWPTTVPGRGGWIILLLYSPFQSAFDRTCRPSEIQPISWTK